MTAARTRIGEVLLPGGPVESLDVKGRRDVAWPIHLARRFLDAGVDLIMIESEGITENVKTWHTDAPDRIIETIGLTKVMSEAADPEVFA